MHRKCQACCIQSMIDGENDSEDGLCQVGGTYLFGTVDTGETDRAVAVILVLLVAVFYANTAVLAYVWILYARIHFGTFLTTHAFVALASARSI